MKRFLLVAMILASAASLYAAELKITGDAEVRGVYDKADMKDVELLNNKFFDADFNFNAALVVTENTTVFTKLTFDSEGMLSGYANSYEGVSIVPDQLAEDFDRGTGDDAHTFLGVERAYISTKVLPALVFDLGLMGGGLWGTAFGNAETNVVRIKANYTLDDTMKFIAYYEKDAESAPAPVGTGIATSDFGDTTTYAVAANLKFGAITLIPLVKYQIAEIAGSDGDSDNTMGLDVAVTGDMGMVGFEAEVIYTKTAGAVSTSDATKYGAYLDVFAKLGIAKVGLAGFYASADAKDGTYNPGSDFDFVMVAEDLNALYLRGLGGAAGVANFLSGMTAVKLYADVKILDSLSAGACFAYGFATDDKVVYGAAAGAYSDKTFWEVDANINYSIDAATTYSIEAGYANMEVKSAVAPVAPDPITQYRVLQKVSVKF